jgi:hypothetical protein
VFCFYLREYNYCMSHQPVPEVPASAPKVGEVYKHYKGDPYKVVSLALHANDEEWMVVYEPLYENPAAPLFTRPLREWGEQVEWQGQTVERFSKQ